MVFQVVGRIGFPGIVGCALLTGCQTVERAASVDHRLASSASSAAEVKADPASSPAADRKPAPGAGASEAGDSSASIRQAPDAETVRTVARQGPEPPPDIPALPDGKRALRLPNGRIFSTNALLPGEVAADDPVRSPSGPPLALDDLLKIAVEANPTLAQAYALVRQTEGNGLQVGLYPNPTVEWHDEANNAPFDAHFGIVAQDIVTAKKLKINRTVASSDVQRARWDAQAQNLRVLNDVRIRYVNVLGAQRQVAVAEELLKIADDGVRVAQRFFTAEEVSQADVLQASLQQRETQITLRNARFRAEAAWRELSNVVGRPSLPTSPLAGNLEDEFPQIDWDVAWRQVLDRSPVLQAAKSRLASVQAQVKRERVEPIPNLQLSGGSGRDVLPKNESFTMFYLTLGADVPIWNRNQGNVAAAQGNLRAAQAEVARLELSLRDELAEAFWRYQSARNEVEIYRDSIIPTAEKNLQLTQNGYDEGEFDFLRVLIARRDLFQARIDYVVSFTDLRASAIAVQGLLLTGGLDPVMSDPTPSNAAGQTTGPGN